MTQGVLIALSFGLWVGLICGMAIVVIAGKIWK